MKMAAKFEILPLLYSLLEKQQNRTITEPYMEPCVPVYGKWIDWKHFGKIIRENKFPPPAEIYFHRILFAGEAMEPYHYGTVHGAMCASVREVYQLKHFEKIICENKILPLADHEILL